MKTRILYGAVMILVLAALLALDWRLGRAAACPAWVVGLPVAALVLCLIPLAILELSRLARSAGLEILSVSGLVGTAALGLWPYWRRLAWPIGAGDGAVALLGLIVILICAEQMVRFRTVEALRRAAATALAVLYVGGGMAVMLSLRMTWGLAMLVVFLAAVKSTDIAAYFVGSAVGRHKLIPWLSPAKSWEGLAAGIVAGAVVAVLVAWALRLGALPPVRAAAFGVVIALAGQFADLCESLLKRSVSAKDSGAVIPQFGGVLDILDSPLLAAPVAWVALSVLPCL